MTFYPSADDYRYPQEQRLDNPMGKNAFCPIEVDTEYTHLPYDINHPIKTISTNLTVQCRAISQPIGKIYAYSDIAPIARHKVWTHEFVALDYLESLGHKVTLQHLESWKDSTPLPWIQFDVYAYFAVAETYRIFQGKCLEDIHRLTLQPDEQGIDQGRRLRTYHTTKGRYYNWIELPWLLTLDNYKYRVRLSIYDTCAIHGIASYKDFCKNTGVELTYKDVFTNSDKARMLDMYINRPEDFDNYALGDLYNYEALIGNVENFYKVYESLDIAEHFTPPRLTIGATVSRIVEGCIKKQFNALPSERDVINAFCTYGTADWLKRKTTTTAALNAKVDGGRCRNNRPTDTVFKGVICDIDISGCYGEGLRAQIYPLGVPVIIDYPVRSDINQYQTLRQFLKKYQSELVPGLWQARVSCKQGHILKYQQDYLISWLPPNDISKMPTDSEVVETDSWWDMDNIGVTKIFNNTIEHAVITHDFIQWLENIATPRQRKELLDNLIIETAMYYPASDRVDSTDDLMTAHATHTGKNTTEVKKRRGNTSKISIEMECHKWYGVNLGDLLITRLLAERKKHPKKTPFNDLYKLCINTVYGDMVSPFFKVGNVVVGNNITARARALAWYMEKGLHGWQTITDGCAFDVNRALYPRDEQRISGELTVNLYADKLSRQYTLQTLDTSGLCSDGATHPCSKSPHPCSDDAISNRVVLTVDTTYNIDGEVAQKTSTLAVPGYNIANLDMAVCMQWVNSTAMTHLQCLFPVVDVLHQATTDVKGHARIGQFEFEAKGFYDNGVFHGSANYAFSLGGDWKFAMRSYSKHGHKILHLTDDIQIINDNGKPSEIFLMALTTPSRIGRSYPHMSEKILKVGDYRRNFKRWENSEAYPGCSVEVVGLLREFSMSQFTFQTVSQWKSWQREYERLMRQYGQSYEMFFMNDDGTLNYQAMVVDVDSKIRGGKQSFFDGMDKRQANAYRSQVRHPNYDCLETTRAQLATRYGNQNFVLGVFGADGDVYVEDE